MAKQTKQKPWTKAELTRVFEILIEKGSTITSHPQFRAMLGRDLNLFANQVTREANGNIAYRSVDFDPSGCSDEAFWERIDNSRYCELIENNAAVALMKMAHKLEIISK